MQTTAPDDRLHVAVGVLRDGSNRYLVQQRIAGQACEGQWEFPGGKLEPGESPLHALSRELHEELGVVVNDATLLMQLPFDYAHARVWLEVFLVDSFEGSVTGLEGQQTNWLQLDEIADIAVLNAVHPILHELRRQSVLGC